MNSKCGCGRGCGVHMTMKVLVIIGGINWGLVGLGMLFGHDWNVVHMILSWAPSTFEALVYLLVGIAAVMKIFGCRCKRCMAAHANCTCGVDNKMAGTV